MEQVTELVRLTSTNSIVLAAGLLHLNPKKQAKKGLRKKVIREYSDASFLCKKQGKWSLSRLLAQMRSVAFGSRAVS
jgi:hypothetical protein